MKERVFRILKEPRYILLWLINKKCGRWLPDALYLKLKYWCYLKRLPNIKKPKYLSEKIQWLKLNDRNELYPLLVDKYAVREYIAKEIGEQYLIPLLGVWERADQIDWDALPAKFVLKCTHGSQTNIICADKSRLDRDSVIKKLDAWMSDNATYYYGREWPYKYVKPRIIAEKFIESDHPGGIVDYKFMCFHGEIDNVMVCSDRMRGNVHFDHFNEKWEHLKYQYADEGKPADYTIEKPEEMDSMFRIAKHLAKNFDFIRVDLYCENGSIYFGELTFYPASGFDTDYTPLTDLYLGSKLRLDGM